MYGNTLYWPPLCKKMSLTITFELKDLRMTILVSRTMFLRSRNPMVPFILPYDLDLSSFFLQLVCKKRSS